MTSTPVPPLPVTSGMAEVPDREVAIGELVFDLILLERDATAAYVRILHRLQDAGARREITRILEARQRRLAELTMLSFTLRSGSPGEAAARHYLPAGRIAIDSLADDGAILDAMLAGEAETVAAYRRSISHPQASPKCRAILERAHQDAVLHCAWAEKAARVVRNP